MVYPNLNCAIAYVMLRPFFQPPLEKGADIMDPHTWTLNEDDGWFPGTFKEQSQRLSRSSHPHLRLEECLVHMPRVKPGDTVWWHCDVSLVPVLNLLVCEANCPRFAMQSIPSILGNKTLL